MNSFKTIFKEFGDKIIIEIIKIYNIKMIFRPTYN